jgi:hypothetical protein
MDTYHLPYEHCRTVTELRITPNSTCIVAKIATMRLDTKETRSITYSVAAYPPRELSYHYLEYANTPRLH